MNKPALRVLAAFFTVLLVPLARADVATHSDSDAFHAEAQALAPRVVPPPMPPPPPGINDTMGVWGPIIPWTPHIPVTAAQLPDGRLLTFASNQRTTFPAGVERTFTAVWNPTTGQFTEYLHPDHDMFCGGAVMLPDGRVMVNGGRNEVVRVSLFDWRTDTWTRIQNMTGGRWYNTSVALPDGQVWTVTGSGTGRQTAERWNQTTGWTLLTGIPWNNVLVEPGYITNWHPFIVLNSDGRLFHFGPTDINRWITWTGTGSMTNSGTNVPGTHYPKEGAWVMYDEGRILVAGGGVNTSNNPADTSTGVSAVDAYTVNLNTNPPTVASTAPMANARQFANAVVLPNGEVVIIGGNTSGLKFNDTGSVFAAEIWNPTTGQWRTAASMQVPRNYHSLALLMPDGRVLSAGGGLSGNAADHQDAQFYTPPQLFNPDGTPAVRPELISVPPQIGAGAVFNVTATPGITQFAFIKMSSITHSMNTDLRRLVLPSTETSPGNYQLTARTNLNVMTPGYWMLFGVLPSGVYSTAAIVQVDATGSVSMANPGNQTSVVNAPLTLQFVSSGPVGVPRTYSVTNLPPGLTLNATTGVVGGSPTALGTYNVRVTVTGGASSSFQDFTWTITAPTLVRDFPNFPNSSGFTLSSAATVTTNVLRLTPLLNSRVGGAFLTQPFNVGPNTSFATRFVFRQHGTADGADGLAFVVQGVSADALGTSGGGLGYGGMGKSLAVEIDSFQGTGDPSGNHVGVVVNGETTTHLATHTPAFDMENGLSHTLWVEYDGPGNVLRVFLAQGVVTTRPATPVITLNSIDLPGITGGPAWFGFTAATGGANNNHDIEAWNLNVNANALPAPPTITAPGNRTTVVNTAASLQIVANDINADLLTFSATGLPAGMTIDPNTGLISGIPTVVGPNSVTVSVSDGYSTPATSTFTWTIASPLAVAPLSGSAVVSGTSVTFTAQATGGINPQYSWDFGDGSPSTAFTSSPTASRNYAAPGRYQVTLTVRDGATELTRTFHQAIHAPLTARRPTRSSTIIFEERPSASGRVWCVNPDNNSVSAFDAVTRARVAEITVGTTPRTLALAPDGRIWVVNGGTSTISIINPTTLAVAATVNLPRASRPFGLAFEPDGTDAWVACEEGGQLLRLNPANGAQISSLSLGANIRHVSVNADSSRVFVSRFVTPPLPGEGTANPQTEAGATKFGGEIIVVNTSTAAVERTVILQHSEQLDTAVSARGIPNYVGGVTISPDGRTAWVPSKQDNIKRGLLRNGQPLTHDMAMRSIASRLDLTAGTPATDTLAARIDFDNAGIASASAFDSKGMYLFTALEGSRTVSVVDAWAGTELFRIEARRAPQGVVVAPDDRTLYVHNFMDRTITTYFIGAVTDGGEEAPPVSETLQCVTTEALSPTVLRGKQFFYDARDERLALQEYISCASCHNDGGQDGRVWDFTQFGEGLRNTILLRGRGGMAHGPLHWSANFDEVQDFEGQIRNFAGGLGLMNDSDFHSGTRSQPLGQSKTGLSADLDALAAYVSSLTQIGSSPARNTDGSLTAAALLGEQVFRQANCASCHASTRFTDSAPGNLRNIGTIKPSSGQRLGGPLTGIDTPTLRGIWNTAPYLHDGSAATISAAVTAHSGVSLSSGDLANLVAYLQQIDDAVTTAPVDNSAPSVILATSSSTVSGAFSVAVTVSEPVTGLVGTDFVVTNGTLSAFTGSGASYGFTVTPAAAGAVTVSLPANSCVDLSGNNNTVSNTVNVTFSPTLPVVNGLHGDYYAGMNFETFVFSRVDSAINFAWPFEAITPAMPRDNFSIRWTGRILPTTTENYTFITSADDGVRLWVNGQLLINNWQNQGTTERQATIALTAGVPADIRLEYYDFEWGAVIRLEWQSASQPRQIIPTARLSAGNARPIPALSTGGTAVNGSFNVAVAFNEPVTGLSTGAFSVANGTATALTGSGSSYTLTVAPTDPGAVSVNLPANGCIDTDGQGNVASNTIGVTFTPPAGALVNGITGDYYQGRNFERFVFTRVDQAVNFTWPFEAPAPTMARDLFSIRWTGKVIPQFTETYTFITSTDDGVRLWVNGQLLIDKWQDQGTTAHQGTIALTAGVPVDVRMEYYDNEWGATARLEWQSASQTRQIIPRERLSAGSGRPVPVLATAGTTVNGPFAVSVSFAESVTGLTVSDFLVANGTATSLSGNGANYTLNVSPAANGEVTVNLPALACTDAQNEFNTAANTISVTYVPLPGATLAGLTGSYFAGRNFETLALTRVDEAVDFNWLINSPGPGVPANLFSVRWTGKVTPLYSETYTFITSTDDGVRLWVNGVQLVNQWQDQGTTSYSGTISLTAGVPVDIRMEYYDNEWGAVARLEWQSASQVRQVIPRDRLSTPAPPAPPEVTTLTQTRLRVDTTEPTGTTVTTTTTPPAPTSGGVRTTDRASARRRVVTTPGAGAIVDLLGAGRGLRAEYFDGADFEERVSERIDADISFRWTETTPPVASIPTDRYSVRWTGRIRPLTTDEYTFHLDTDDGVRLWIDGQLIIDRWAPGLPFASEVTGVPVSLRAGQYHDVRLEFQNTDADARIRLDWESDLLPREPVPALRLFQPAP